MADRYAIILAAGSGSRLGGSIPKQFQPLAGIPMMVYSIRAFHEADKSIKLFVVIPPTFSDQWSVLEMESGIELPPYQIVHGGEERFYSVLFALNKIGKKKGVVAVHDSARPFISVNLILRAFETASNVGSAIPCIGIKETVRQKSGNKWIHANREAFKIVQTPQTFDLAKLYEAYQVTFNPGFTDDASVYEVAGWPIHLIPGEEFNFKVTTPVEFTFAQFLLENNILTLK